MEDRRVADYFVVTGLPIKNPEPVEDFCSEGINLKSTYNQAPITDMAVIFRNLGESAPAGFVVIDTTISGLCADLNHGSIRSPNVFLCYRRGWNKPPLVDIGVLYEGKDRLLPDSEVILATPYGRPANVNNSGSKTYITFRRATETAPCNELVVTDICVILSNKGEVPPHTFCMIPKNLNKGMVGSDVYLCYKKSMNRANSIAYKPVVLDKFPMTEYDNFALPPSVPLFCLPMGATIECWPAKASSPRPVFSTFILTSHTVEKVYGAAITFYERYPENEHLTAEQRQLLKLDESPPASKTVNINKCICILSHWPFFDTFEKFLLYLYKMSISGPHTIPIERYISYFMTEIPFPSPQRPSILIQLNNNDYDRISLEQPEDSPLPLSGSSFHQLLKNLGPDNCLTILLFALTEQKILIHSLRPDVLTSVAEAVSMLIFPFHWQCPYIPLCPLALSDVLFAPMAFIVGVDSRYFDLYDPPLDVTCVDLDTTSISVSEEKRNVTAKLLPKKPARMLRNTLHALFERMHRLSQYARQAQQLGQAPIEKDFKLRKEELAIELEIQEAFLRFTASVLKGFRSFLQPITKAPTIGATDCSSLFDIQGFLKSRDKAYHRFYSMLTKTQMFTRFIEERSFVSDKDVGLAFFDDCTEKVDTGEYPEARLLELEESHQSERTVFITPPEPINLPHEVTYTYTSFKALNPKLYLDKRRMKTWVSPIAKSSPAPGSPLAKRTKQEIRSAQQTAKKHSEDPALWSKCLVGYCYTLWFIHLPAYVKTCHSKPKALHMAYDVLVKMQSARLHPPDEVCYRVLMQLCGQYSQPVLAVKLLSEMKRNGVQPNAITYGYYNKAVLESTWPAGSTNGYLLWNKLRNVIISVALFKRGMTRRPFSVYSESDYDGVSRGSTEGSTADVSLPVEGVTDLKAEDGGSTGGQSDVGYNSMNTDETQKSSSSISSQLTTNDGETGTLNAEQQRPTPKSVLKEPGSKNKPTNRMLKFEDVDFTESDQLRNQLKSIVRSSVSTLGSLNTIGRDVDVDSLAGVLITGRNSIYDDDVFDDSGLMIRWRKRHRSASDFAQRGVSGSVGSSAQRYHRVRHRSGPDPALSLSRPLSHENDQEMLRSDSFGNDAKILTSLNASATTAKPTNECNGEINDPCVKDIPESGGVGDNSVTVETHVDDMDCLLPPPPPPPPQNTPSSEDVSAGTTKKPHVPKRKKSVYEGPHLMMPVTQNDPLGLFDAEKSLNSSSPVTSTPSSSAMKTIGSAFPSSWFELDMRFKKLRSGTLPPVDSSEFPKVAKVTRSATFCHSPEHVSKLNAADDAAAEVKRVIHRSSSVLPESPMCQQPQRSTSASSLMSPTSLASLANLRFSFHQSPRKADIFGSLKSAATTMASKLSEIKEAISATGTPVKSLSLSGGRLSMERKISCEEDATTASELTQQRNSVDYLSRSSVTEDLLPDELDSLMRDAKRARSLSFNVLPSTGASSLQDLPAIGLGGDKLPFCKTLVALEIIMSSCSRCHTCGSILYDEEIMIGWTAEDSNLNTRCQFCGNKLVPFLVVNIRDYRVTDGKLSAAQSVESMQSAPSLPNLPIQRVSVSSSNMDIQQEPVESVSFFMEEDSPESASLSSGVSSPMGSPQKSTGILEAMDGVAEQQSIVCNNRQKLLSGTEKIVRPVCTSGGGGGSGGGSHSVVRTLYAVPEMVEDQSPSVRGECGTAVPLVVGDEINSSLSSSRASSVADVTTRGNNVAREPLSSPFTSLEPISVPYLSPIVLRKELENVLDHEGDGCLSESRFVDEHPIIYWNLMWYFERIDVPSYLTGLCLSAQSVNKDREIPANWLSADFSNVVVRCMWDNVKLHEDVGQPMYMLWGQNATPSPLVHALVTEQKSVTKELMQKVVADVAHDNLYEPLKLLLGNVQKCSLPSGPMKLRRHSVYRDILFLIITAIGRENISISSFEREYRRAYNQLPPSYADLTQKFDKPPSVGVILCRQPFKDLELL